MKIIRKRKLEEFRAKHATSRASLENWYHTVKNAEWTKFSDVKNTYGKSVDQWSKGDKDFYIFEIGDDRLIAGIQYAYKKTRAKGTVFIKFVLTHPEYDKGQWKGKL